MTRGTQQTVTATQEWRKRMKAARENLPESIGPQDVIVWIVKHNPELDRLTNASRWRNAWLGRVSDPEFTVLVEKAATFFQAKAKVTSDRLRRQKLKKVQ